VISESLDGEVVIIDLTSGTYYSLRGPGARAWDGLAAGWSAAEVEADLRTGFDVDGRDVGAELDAFVATLLVEGLLVEGTADAPTGPPGPFEHREPWAPLSLETFTDMQELILLDPVHEVQPNEGWPASLDLDRH
jgi:hypothetical protein